MTKHTWRPPASRPSQRRTSGRLRRLTQATRRKKAARNARRGRVPKGRA